MKLMINFIEMHKYTISFHKVHNNLINIFKSHRLNFKKQAFISITVLCIMKSNKSYIH
jgi:hypothetical protein